MQKEIKHHYFLLFAIFLFLIYINAFTQTVRPKIMVTGFWNPTGQMISHFSRDTTLNPEGWQGENWMGLGFDIYSFFPEPYTYIGDFMIDYQNILHDFHAVTDTLNPIAIISYGAGNGPWEIEEHSRNLQFWNDDDIPPYQPVPTPPDSTMPVNSKRYSALPIENIMNAVNNETAIFARKDIYGMGAYICEYIGYQEMWYHDLYHLNPVKNCLVSGFVHVQEDLDLEEVIIASDITIRETLYALLDSIIHIKGMVICDSANLSVVGTQVDFYGPETYNLTINNDSGRYTIPYISPGVYQVTARLNNKYGFDTSSVVVDSSGVLNIKLKYLTEVNNTYLSQNFPNPFNSEGTTIRFGLPEKSGVTLSIYDFSGRKITTLLDDDMEAGEHSVSWNGTNQNGENVHSGLYIYGITTDGFTDFKRCMLLK